MVNKFNKNLIRGAKRTNPKPKRKIQYFFGQLCRAPKTMPKNIATPPLMAEITITINQTAQFITRSFF